MKNDNHAGNADSVRRRLLITLGGLGTLWVAAAAYPIYKFLSPQAQPDPFDEEGKAKVEGVALAELANPGQGANGSYAGKGLIIFRAADGALKAFDSKCTHAGCNVSYQGDQFFCHCHGGIYDLDGKNIAGPPPRPLTPLPVVERDGVLFVQRPVTKGA